MKRPIRPVAIMLVFIIMPSTPVPLLPALLEINPLIRLTTDTERRKNFSVIIHTIFTV
jgi:hypothetical protein